MKIFTVNSLEKIFKDSGSFIIEKGGVLLRNEVYRFQLVFKSEKEFKDVSVEIDGGSFECGLRYVKDLRADNEYGKDPDDYFLKSADRMYPEILTEKLPDFYEAEIWHRFWVRLTAKDCAAVGIHTLKIRLRSDGAVSDETEYTIEIIDNDLPKIDIPVTCWMHYDCIAHQHKVKLFAPKFYKIFEKYLDLYVKSGHTMLLIPSVTPALDTAVGGERLTAQLVNIAKKGDIYSFGFGRLDKFINFIKSKGIRYFEFAHLFTQWGATACPKIIARTENGGKKIFGWDTPSDGEEYKRFLSQYLPALVAYLEKKGIAEQSFFHLSDEPSAEHIDNYERLYRFVKQYSGNIKTIDALSDYNFYKRGIVDVPVASSNHAGAFLKNGAKHLVYYCCVQNKEYAANRFFAMPSERNAVLGVQLYQNEALGFLQWGFNFYNTRYSIKPLNPYIDTASGGAFPSGDAFVVYPDGNEVISSLRLEVFHEGIQLYLALKRLESLIGRDKIIRLLEARGFSGYDTYPHSPQELKGLKKEIYNHIKSHNKQQ
jgi:hypothetical protein